MATADAFIDGCRGFLQHFGRPLSRKAAIGDVLQRVGDILIELELADEGKRLCGLGSAFLREAAAATLGENRQPIRAVGDVLQIYPDHLVLGGCFAVVTEVRDWGVLADVPLATDKVAPVRLRPDEFRVIGGAHWLRGT